MSTTPSENRNSNDEILSTSYYMVQDLYQSLEEKDNGNTFDHESTLSTIIQRHEDPMDPHRQQQQQQQQQQQPEEQEQREQANSVWNGTKDIWNQLKQIYRKETLLVEVLIVIMLAKIYPRIGTDFVFPEITAHWIAVMTIFCKFLLSITLVR